LLSGGLELGLWLASISKRLPDLLGSVVVRDVEGGAESLPFLVHLIDFNLSLLLILFGLDSLFLLFLLGELS